MRILVNGDPLEVAEGSTIADLLQNLQMQPRYVAVERNQQLVPRAQHASSQLAPDDSIEIVTLVGGG